MTDSWFEAIPLWLVFVATMGFIVLAVEAGFWAGIHQARRSEDARHAVIDPVVGSTLGLLAFMLAFTFGMATTRYDARRQLVLDEVIAIRTADLRAQLLAEPQRHEIRALVREYVDVRIRGVLVPGELARALARSEELQDQLWTRAAALGQEGPAGPFTAALIQMIDLHSRRVTAGLRNGIPGTIWLALYCVTGLAMVITGYRTGIAGRRSMAATLVLALAFSAVILLIANLDRPQQGFLKVSQDAMLELQTKLRHR